MQLKSHHESYKSSRSRKKVCYNPQKRTENAKTLTFDDAPQIASLGVKNHAIAKTRVLTMQHKSQTGGRETYKSPRGPKIVCYNLQFDMKT